LILDNQSIVALLEGYDKESKALRTETLKICWYMRGSLSYDEGFTLSPQDREIINSIIKENLDVTKKSGLPFF